MTAAHTHGAEELCEAGHDLYTRALREGRVLAVEADEAPCLVDLGLLQPDLGDLRWLRPVTPAFALHRLLRTVEDRIADERRREERLTAMFASLLEIDGPHAAAAGAPMISVLSGLDRIGQAIHRTVADASGEVLTIQPHTGHTHSPAETHAEALVRDQDLLDRGGRIRVLHQHTLRHAPGILARYERLHGDVEARTLDEVTQHLIVVERKVAFIPADKDRTLALEIRHPPPSSGSSPPPSTACGGWPPRCTPEPSSSRPSTASPPARRPSPPCSSRAAPTPSSPTGSA
ncbi:hypothetical protein RKD19_003899 [Streptomyces canus]